MVMITYSRTFLDGRILIASIANWMHAITCTGSRGRNGKYKSTTFGELLTLFPKDLKKDPKINLKYKLVSPFFGEERRR